MSLEEAAKEVYRTSVSCAEGSDLYQKSPWMSGTSSVVACVSLAEVRGRGGG